MFYLNGGDDFEGGLTNFLHSETKELRHALKPEPGLGLIFRQLDRRTLHEGSVVTRGCKYILRTDVMYRAINE